MFFIEARVLFFSVSIAVSFAWFSSFNFCKASRLLFSSLFKKPLWASEPINKVLAVANALSRVFLASVSSFWAASLFFWASSYALFASALFFSASVTAASAFDLSSLEADAANFFAASNSETALSLAALAADAAAEALLAESLAWA